MQKLSHALLYLLLIAIAVSVVPSSAQVTHENPSSAVPTKGMPIQDELIGYLDKMQLNLESVSAALNDNNFSLARQYFDSYSAISDTYLDRLSYLNVSETDYAAIADNINFSKIELYQFIRNSDLYNQSYADYDQSVASGNTSGASSSADSMRVSYESLTAAYDRFRSNATIIEQALQNNNVDTTGFDNSLNNMNDYIGHLSVGYNQAGIGSGGSSGNNPNYGTDLRLTVEPGVASIGESVQITVKYAAANGIPMSDTAINVYSNNFLIGKSRTDISGASYTAYTIPANVTADRLRIHAEALLANGSRAFSNVQELSIPDKETRLNITADKDSASYGESIKFSGILTAEDGTPVPDKLISVYANDELAGTTRTDAGGAYSYDLGIKPDTAAGKYGVYASYMRRPNGVFLNSTSEQYSVTVVPKYTRLAIDNHSGFKPGDMAHVTGTLRTEDGVPVSGANVVTYIDGVSYGNNSTDNGVYDVAFAIPDNAAVGAHELYASFEPGEGKALNGSSSDKAQVTFEEKAVKATVEGMPIVLFNNDTLNVNGTLTTESGMPIEGKMLGISVSGTQVGPVMTDDNGMFNATYIIRGSEPLGFNPVSVYDIDASGQPAATYYSGQVLIIPYDMLLALGVPLLLITVIAVITAITISGRKPRVKAPDKISLETAPKPDKVEERATVVLPAWSLAEAENKGKDETPAPSNTATLAPDTKSGPGPRPEPKPEPGFSIDDELRSVKFTINSGNLEEALTHIYVASRKIAVIQGDNIPDSMTHNEFYDYMKAKHPSLARPLAQIVKTYEKVSFAHREVNTSELNAAVMGLKEVYLEFKKQGESH